jgi:hypothetical protein
VAVEASRTKTLELWSVWFQIIAHICTVVTLAALFFQMEASQNTQRIAQSLEYVAQLHSEPISTDRGNIEAALLPYQADLIQLNKTEGAPRSELDRLVFDAIESQDKKNSGASVRISVMQLALFYDHVLICRKERICNGRVIDEYFRPQMNEFWNNFETIIRDFRSAGTTNLGACLENYLNSPNQKCDVKRGEE